jgi:uracil-DNA glycosylase family 4
VREAASAPHALDALGEAVVRCRRCPRLVAWRERVAREKRAAFAGEEYWGRPVPGFGDPAARVLAVGLAPAAHGANRTGRMFTGDRSGDWLFRALHRAGFANRPASVRPGDGLALSDLWLTAAVRCAPPGNQPTPAERRSCRPYLEEEIRVLGSRLRVAVALGGYAWSHVLRVLVDEGWRVPRPRPAFGHGVEVVVGRPAGAPAREGAPDDVLVLASYHPSQQNTFTGTLTEEMFDRVWARAARARVERAEPPGISPP